MVIANRMSVYFRYFFKLTAAYISRFRAIIVISIILGAIIFAALLFIIPSFTNYKLERIAVTGRYYSDNLPSEILSLMSEGLTKINEGGVVEPALASSWETPDKGKTWVFRLKDNIFWQDNTEITSDTIQYDFSDVQIERPDSQTIVFKLDQPFSPFPSVVSTPLFKKGLLGMKEWKIKNISVVGSYVEKLELEDGKAQKLYRFYPTIERTKLAYKLGEVDTILNFPEAQPFDTWSTANVKQKPNQKQIVTLFFNTQDKLLSEKSARQALAYAIDKDKLGTRAISSISPTSWAYNPQVKRYDYSIDRAKELWDDIPKEAKGDASVKLTAIPSLLPTAEAIANDWRRLGITVSVQIVTTTPSDYQALLLLYEIPTDPDQYTSWHSTQVTTNITHYTSQRIDRLLEEGRTFIDMEERRKVYLDFQRFLLEDLPALFLYYPQYFTVERK